MGCELCGKKVDLVRASVEGTELTVCAPCGKYGRILKRSPVEQKVQQRAKRPEVVEIVVEDYAQIIRQAREKRGMTQKEFANILTEKESILQKMESDGFRPSISLARKLEKMLRISLVELQPEKVSAVSQKKSGPLTIGDLIKFK